MISSTSKQGGNPLGDSLIEGVDGFNRLLNTPAMSSVGQAFNATGILTPVHFLADIAGYSAMKAVEGIGRALGGKGDIDYHMKDEWGIGGSSSGKPRGDASSTRGAARWDGSMSACRDEASARFERGSRHDGFHDCGALRGPRPDDAAFTGLHGHHGYHCRYPMTMLSLASNDGSFAHTTTAVSVDLRY